MMEARVPKHLRVRVLAYFRRTKRSTLRSLDVVLDGLPDSLCAELELHVWHKALYTEDPRAPESVKLNPLLQGVSSHVLSRLVQKFQVKELAPNEVLLRAGQDSSCLFFILAGMLEVKDPLDRTLVATLREGGWCGDSALVKGENAAPFEVRAHGWSTVLALSHDAMREVLMGHDEDAHWMKCVAEERWMRFMAAYALSACIHEMLTTAPRREELTHEFLIRELAEVRDYETDALKHAERPAHTFRQKRLAWRRRIKEQQQRSESAGDVVRLHRRDSLLDSTLTKMPTLRKLGVSGDTAGREESGNLSGTMTGQSAIAARRARHPLLEQLDRKEVGDLQGSGDEDTAEYPVSTLWMLAEAADFRLERVGLAVDLARHLTRSRADEGGEGAGAGAGPGGWDIARDFVDSQDVVQAARARQLEAFPTTQVWVQCIRASHLRDDRFGGLIDRAHPFCRFALAGTSFETLVVDNAANPEWNEEFLFAVQHPLDTAEMRVFVMDFEDEHKTYLMAICDIPIGNLPLGEWVDDEFELTNRSGARAGTLRLRLKHVPQSERREDPPRVVRELLDREGKESQGRMIELLNSVDRRLEAVHCETVERAKQLKAEVLQATKAVLHETKAPSFERLGEEVLLEEASSPSTPKKPTHPLGALRGKERKALRKVVKALRARVRGRDGELEEDGSDQEEVENARRQEERERQQAVDKLRQQWKRYESKATGRPFWFNKYTKETRVTDPVASFSLSTTAGVVEAKPADGGREARAGTMVLRDLPDGWLQRLSRSKNLVFFQNMYDGATSWQVPRAPHDRQSLLAELGGLVDSSMLADVRKTFGHGVYRAIPMRAPARMPRGAAEHGDVYAFFSAESGAHQGGWAAESNRAERPGELKRAEIRYKSGDSRVVYRGEMKGQKRHGTGVMQFADGVVYQGQWEDDYPSGFGVEVYPDGFIYKGQFLRDCRHGLGVLQCPSLAYYGCWARGRRHGSGVERLLMKGRAVEAFSVFEEGVVVERGRADFENAREARDIRDATKAQERRAKVFAETARLVDVRVKGLMDRLSQQRRHDMLVAEGYEDPDDLEDEEEADLTIAALFGEDGEEGEGE